jgi:integrase
MGIEKGEQTAHGVRAAASTLLNKQNWSPDLIELQLAHAPQDRVRAVYNRSVRIEERRKMMQYWADFLDRLRLGAETGVVLPFKATASSIG